MYYDNRNMMNLQAVDRSHYALHRKSWDVLKSLSKPAKLTTSNRLRTVEYKKVDLCTHY